jgi:hypothetical protein
LTFFLAIHAPLPRGKGTLNFSSSFFSTSNFSYLKGHVQFVHKMLPIALNSSITSRDGGPGQGCARIFKIVAPQKQNTVCKQRAQYAKRNCALKLFKAHCAATSND